MKQNAHRVSLVILTAMFAVLCSVSKTQAGCYCMMRNMEISADYSKSGIQGCTTNVIDEWYLQSTEVNIVTGSGSESGNGVFDDWQVSRKTRTVITFSLSDLLSGFSGGHTSEGCAEYTLPWTETINMSDNGNSADQNEFSQWNGSGTTVEDSSGDYTDSPSGTVAWLFVVL